MSGEKLIREIERLNPEQRHAVETGEGPLLLVAGAGSGKTGVITARIALMLENGIPQSRILALTFTNKAAREMEERVKALTGMQVSKLTISTFHAFGLRIIREQITTMGLRPKFTIYDTSDKNSVIREAAKELKIHYEPSEIMALSTLFSDIKTRRKKWDGINKAHKPLYNEYMEFMSLYNAVDFDDLIIKPLELFEKDEEIRAKYQQRYQYIMVDEFQDTSTVQYLLVKHLSEVHRNICCVGDDDQSIYSWRGADYTNILNFEKDFPELVEIKLERNYRSTGTILKAANAIIANNQDRKDKALWTHDKHDEMNIQITTSETDTEEAQFIADTILSLKSSGNFSFQEIGILVRTNALTRNIEEALLSENIPYAVSGGTSFFSRQEIKDIIAYLRIIENPDDNVNCIRIINIPRRGVGKTSLQTLIDLSKEQHCSLYSAAMGMVFGPQKKIRGSVNEGLAEFLDIIEAYQERFAPDENGKTSLAQPLRDLLEEIDYWPYLLQEFRHNEKIAKWRYENIQTFIDIMERWENHPDNLEPTLTRWLNRITLNTRDQIAEDENGKVHLMTIHASKGLEFDTVFLPGVENGIIPHAKSVEENPHALEEERRLFYVAVTRARKQLYISSCQSRQIRQERIICSPSPFLNEIPQDLMEEADTEEQILGAEEMEKIMATLPWMQGK